MSKPLAGDLKIIIEGVIIEDPQTIAYGAGHDFVTVHIQYIFPLKFTKLIGGPEGLSGLPIKENDTVMVELNGKAYAKKDHTVELTGKLESRGYSISAQKSFIFAAEKLFNLTYGYSVEY